MGGVHDIQEDLKRNGYTVHTAAVGPVSSNWDRACELYAQINGGTVDYGAAHAENMDIIVLVELIVVLRRIGVKQIKFI